MVLKVRTSAAAQKPRKLGQIAIHEYVKTYEGMASGRAEIASRKPRLRKLLEKMRLAKRVPIASESTATTRASEIVLVMISNVLRRKRIVVNSSWDMDRTRKMR